ncbi:ubiquitin-conjugating enzyme E2 7-like isoform X3 [Phoenix dactylifera]|uniref:Ubiquitin-conjugating enzyme E2 7-like isoform X3 n=1 Tax=Phoenix dactylifera TaxID=42345 RepID=A0A8B9A2W9_PHODC|nr:ubiquitin-conjugating enzyme E2 7-like isoform X3 [Phoenix dactylifera]
MSVLLLSFPSFLFGSEDSPPPSPPPTPSFSLFHVSPFSLAESLSLSGCLVDGRDEPSEPAPREAAESDGGYFNAIMSFPANYPNSPPTVRFTSEMWHPNVYPDGRVCISILHPPGEDPNGYELASERWTPVHTVESIVLSIISMLSSPNDESPANVEAAKEWREMRDAFKKKVSRIVRRSQEML